jgi:CcmD family protein
LDRLPVIVRRAAPALLILLVVTTVLSAQSPAQDGFVPVTGNEADVEKLPAAPLVFAAYGFVWVAMIAYVFSLWRRLVRVERELADVSARLEARRR